MPAPRNPIPAKHGRDHRAGGADPIGLTGSRMPWVLFEGSLASQTVVQDTDYYPPLTGLTVNPSNAGGTVDSTVFGGIDAGDAEIAIETGGNSNEPFKSVHVKQPGLYYVEASAIWFTDWGAFRINAVDEHSDGENSVLSVALRLNSTENSYFGGAPSTKLATTPASAAIQYSVLFRNLYAVDERATDVHFNYYIRNASTSDHTYPGSDPTGVFTFFVMQVSPSGHSNPPG